MGKSSVFNALKATAFSLKILRLGVIAQELLRDLMIPTVWPPIKLSQVQRAQVLEKVFDSPIKPS